MPPKPTVLRKSLTLQNPVLYLITSGETTPQTTPVTKDFLTVLHLVQAAVAAGINLVQVREKNLSAGVLYQLSVSAARITRGSGTKLLINDRSDIAAAAGADGVHLTGQSLPTEVVRRTFGDEFLIGVSTHSAQEACVARRSGADFVVFGPLFETGSKAGYGPPLGLPSLEKVCLELTSFPVLALGGVTTGTVAACLDSGACGVAGISMFSDPNRLAEVVNTIRATARRETN